MARRTGARTAMPPEAGALIRDGPPLDVKGLGDSATAHMAKSARMVVAASRRKVSIGRLLKVSLPSHPEDDLIRHELPWPFGLDRGLLDGNFSRYRVR